MSYYKKFETHNKRYSDRYKSCLLLEDTSTGERLIESRDIIKIPVSYSDKFHVVQPHEVGRLDLISHMYYKNALFWWVIAQANDIYDIFQDMRSGMTLRIPTIETLYGYKGILL